MKNQIIESKRNTVSNGFEMRPSSLAEAMELSKIMASSDIVPKDFKGKPGNVLVAIQMGHEIGLQPMQALQSIAVINGKPAIYGDAAIALAMNHPDCEDIIEEIVQDQQGNHRARCTVKRKGHEPHTYEFSVEDAKKANLWGKAGPWSAYPKRMLQMRARGFALRDKFSDALKGLSIREEVLDYEIIDNDSGVLSNQEHPLYRRKSDRMADKLQESEFFEVKIPEETNQVQEITKDRDYTIIEENFIETESISE
jgi:hypothetical protein